MEPKPVSHTNMVAFSCRISESENKRLEELCRRYAAQGFSLSKNKTLQRVLIAGFEAIEANHR